MDLATLIGMFAGFAVIAAAIAMKPGAAFFFN